MNLQQILQHPGTKRFLSEEAIIAHDMFKILPHMHRQLLLMSNGLTIYDGYFRLFGLNGIDYLDISIWNSINTWKFAWGTKTIEYICIGESAWGDQYAYLKDELEDNTKEPQVYFLDNSTMDASLISKNFEEFLHNAFMEYVTHPNTTLVKIKKKIGTINIREHLTYSPSLLFDASKKMKNIMRLNAIDSMIINGDLYCQMINNQHAIVNGVEIYQDEMNRNRLRVIWR